MIKKLLLSNVVDSSNNLGITHVTSDTITGRRKYNLTGSTLDEFHETYCSILAGDIDSDDGFGFDIAERCGEKAMFVVDFDIAVKGETKPRKLYSNVELTRYIYLIQQVINAYFSDTKDYSTCIVQEKPAYINSNKCKNGFHLAFPDVIVNRANCVNLHSKIKTILHSDPVFIEHSETCDIEYDEVLSTIGTFWHMYGSAKNEASGKYAITKVFKFDSNGTEELKDMGTYFNTCVIKTAGSVDIEDVKERGWEFYLPILLSINKPYLKATPLSTRNRTVSLGKDITSSNRQLENKVRMVTEANNAETYDFAKVLLENCINAERAYNRLDWIKIGWILWNIFDGNESGRLLFHNFSMNAPSKYNMEEVNLNWNTMRSGNYSISSLSNIARKDNPVAYSKIMADRSADLVDLSFGTTDLAAAKLINMIFAGRFASDSDKPGDWYSYEPENGVWTSSSGEILFKKIINDYVIPIYMDALRRKSDMLDSNPEDKILLKEVISFNSFIKRLSSNSGKVAICKEAATLCYKRDFGKKLGLNPNIFCFNNTVFDTKNHIMRAPEPEDLITKKSGIDYIEYDDNDPILEEVEEFFEKMMPNKARREFFLDCMAELFAGGNKRKLVYIFTGGGDNGKSVMKSVIQKIFGDYCIDLPNSVVFGNKAKAGQATPELARCSGGTRVTFIQESNGNDTINSGALKELSGNDSIYIRELFRGGRDILPLNKIILVCNDMPKSDCIDQALYNRLVVFSFESLFTDAHPKCPLEQKRTNTYPKDEKYINDVYNRLLPAIAFFLAKRLKNIPEVNKPPIEVTAAKDAYRKSQDIYGQFVDDHLRVSTSPKETSYVSMYANFLKYCKAVLCRSTFPTKDVAIKHIRQSLKQRSIDYDEKDTGLFYNLDYLPDGTSED